jgi:hypothetical protein
MSEYDIGNFMEPVVLDLNQKLIKNPAVTFLRQGKRLVDGR